MERRGLLIQDLSWAAFLLVMALGFGLVKQWPLVSLAYKGGLPAYLEEMRSQRRQTQFQGVKTLNLAQAYELFQGGQTLFIDARSPKEFAELHVSRAINLPSEKFKEGDIPALSGIARERRIVVYCGVARCDIALKVAEKLQSLGFTQVTAYTGGFHAWDEAGYPAETEK